jgi:hypothetical protein
MDPIKSTPPTGRPHPSRLVKLVGGAAVTGACLIGVWSIFANVSSAKQSIAAADASYSAAAAGLGQPATNTNAPSQASPPTPLETPTATPTPTPAPAYDVVFACKGSAPQGLEITYGSDSSNYSGTSLPFQATLPLDDSALYYDTEAQLQGGGSVSCTTTVNFDDGLGGTTTVSKTGIASGGFNLANAQVCREPVAGWEGC